MKRFVKCLAMLAAVLAVTEPARTVFAAYPLATDDAGIVRQGSYELEVGYDNCRDENELVNQTCGISFKHGITGKMDIGLSVPFQVDPADEDRLGASALTLKFSLIEDMLAFSYSNETGEKDYFVNAIFTKEFSSAKVNLNAGYLSAGDETVKGVGAYGVSLEVPVKKFEAVGEAQGQEGGEGSCLAGLRYRVSDNFFVAAGFSRQFTRNTNRGTAGFHLEF